MSTPSPKVAAPIDPVARACAALDAWTALEVTEPRVWDKVGDLVPKHRRSGDPVTALRGGVPWPGGEAPDGHRRFYDVSLGAIRMPVASDAVRAVYGEDEVGELPRKGWSSLGAVLVDADGVPTSDGFAVSSFAWAVGRCLSGNGRRLDGWPAEEAALVQDLRSEVVDPPGSGEPRPLDVALVERFHALLVRRLGLPSSAVALTPFAVATDHREDDPDPPRTHVVNSMYLRDLGRVRVAVGEGRAGVGLSRYLGVVDPGPPLDPLADRETLEATLAPDRFPDARWPAPGGHPLVTLQQTAVNEIHARLSHGEGIVAVNGPPGTGKTTLLRDVVAMTADARAGAMVAFEDPADAFERTGETYDVGTMTIDLHRPHPTLLGHGVVVASANNRAVENVSRELPLSSAVGGDGPSYLPTLADAVNGLPDGSSWGAVAAVLGRASNRRRFAGAFWFDDDTSLLNYIRGLDGRAREVEVRGEDGRVRRRTARIVEREAPPTRARAKRRWAKARVAYGQARDDVRGWSRALAVARTARIDRAALEPAIDRARNGLVRADARHAAAAFAASVARDRAAAARLALGRVERRASAHDGARPGRLASLFRRHGRAWWAKERVAITKEVGRREEALGRALTSLADKDDALARARFDVLTTRGDLAALAERARTLEAASVLPEGSRPVDGAFFDGGHDVWNVAAPWWPAEAHAARERLFAAAMDVHRAFLDAAPGPYRDNLSAFVHVLGRGAAPSPDTMGDLWDTFHMVVPVVSTTFASVQSLFAGTADGRIGWLLVDEGGQATPQAAVGAISRARRTVVVGDPRQIVPVTTLPGGLVRATLAAHGLDPDVWAAPAASVQTLADAASTMRSTFGADGDERTVGVPLLVHRRCDDPAFSVSNEVAYDGKMVHAVADRPPSPTVGALGPSRWIPVEGEGGATKWVEAEGEAVVDLFHRLRRAGVDDPDLFVVSPFREVVAGLRGVLCAEGGPLGTLVDDPAGWCAERVGTVHTVQGREADATVLVLGASSPEAAGARRWAAGTPNIVNVAASRAKRAFYVIGSRTAWGTVGHMRTVAEWLPVEGPLDVRCQTDDGTGPPGGTGPSVDVAVDAGASLVVGTATT